MAIPFEYQDFSGGLHSRGFPYLEAPDNVARSLLNVVADTNGTLLKRNGSSSFATPATACTSLFGYEDTVKSVLVASDGANIYKILPNATSTSIGSGFATGSYWSILQTASVSGRGPIYMMNGVDTPQTWDGAVASVSAWTATTGTVPNGRYMIFAGNRLWVAGVGNPGAPNASRVFFSELIPANNGTINWPSSNVDVFDEDDGRPITGLGKVGPYVLVSKANKLYVITDMNTGDARRLSDNVGCVSFRSMVESPQGTFFLSGDRGVYLTNGSKLTPISDQIQPTIDSIVDNTTAAGAYFNGHYYLAVNLFGTVGSGNDTVLDYDTVLNSWWMHRYPGGTSQYAVWTGGTGSRALYGASNSQALIQRLFVPGKLVDGSTPFQWMWRGPWQSPTFYRRRRFPTSYFRKNFRQLRVEGSGTVDVYTTNDFGGVDHLRQANIFSGQSATVNRARIHSLGVHNAVSLRLSATSSTADQVNSFTWYVTDRRDGQIS